MSSGSPVACRRSGLLFKAAGRSLGSALTLQAILWMSACSTTPAYGSAEDRLADEALATRVQDALRRDPLLYDVHITVTAEAGVVRLSGVLSEADDIYEVRRIVKAVPGVTRVANDLRLVDRR
jgi:osmotically-inducible protein OsmY